MMSVIILFILGIFLGLLLAFAAKKFQTNIDQRSQKIIEVLPGANCGACGYAGCSSYAQAIIDENVAVSLCPVGGEQVVVKIKNILGNNENTVTRPKVAYVYCRGGSKDGYTYSGIKSCQAVNLYEQGSKLCKYGCLGYGDCLKVCKFGAITFNQNGVPVIDKTKCVSCGACVASCPKDLIKIIPLKEVRAVTCKSHDVGKVAREICQNACIGCGICAKNCPYEAITMDNSLAVIDAEKCLNCGICLEKCPTKAIC